jgi:hypothetical protein
VIRALVAATGSAAAARAATALLRQHPVTVPGWQRTNFAGRPVTLDAGAAAVAGALAGAWCQPRPLRLPATLLVGTAAVAGAYDDLVAARRETSADKGWHGHLAAARRGRLSGGAVKVVAIGAASLVSARLGADGWRRAVPAAVLTAASANLVNLFDLRPGRAAKLVTAFGLVTGTGPTGPVGAAAAASAAAVLPEDLAERSMLGDMGANALGALVGLRLARGGPLVRAGALAAVLGLTALSERVSFSAVIASTAWLRRLDQAGRRYPAAASGAASEQ